MFQLWLSRINSPNWNYYFSKKLRTVSLQPTKIILDLLVGLRSQSAPLYVSSEWVGRSFVGSSKGSLCIQASCGPWEAPKAQTSVVQNCRSGVLGSGLFFPLSSSYFFSFFFYYLCFLNFFPTKVTFLWLFLFFFSLNNKISVWVDSAWNGISLVHLQRESNSRWCWYVSQ